MTQALLAVNMALLAGFAWMARVYVNRMEHHMRQNHELRNAIYRLELVAGLLWKKTFDEEMPRLTEGIPDKMERSAQE